MAQKRFCLSSGILCLLIAIGHLFCLIFGWEAMIAGAVVPILASWIALVIAGYLGFEGLKLSRKT